VGRPADNAISAKASGTFAEEASTRPPRAADMNPRLPSARPPVPRPGQGTGTRCAPTCRGWICARRGSGPWGRPSSLGPRDPTLRRAHAPSRERGIAVDRRSPRLSRARHRRRTPGPGNRAGGLTGARDPHAVERKERASNHPPMPRPARVRGRRSSAGRAPGRGTAHTRRSGSPSGASYASHASSSARRPFTQRNRPARPRRCAQRRRQAHQAAATESTLPLSAASKPRIVTPRPPSCDRPDDE